PSADEVLPPRLTLADGGEALLVATRQNEEAPTRSAVLVRVRRADGRLSTVHRLSGALVALAAAPVPGGSLVVTGAGAWRGRCCVSAAVRTVSSSGRIGRARTVFGSISGAAAGAVT